ncbi:hypothetical protein ColLi_13183 [Colletotrichum liriopes]|uniref:Uncharacterized protein n=1 Tax=Colletotrichum liriopes TaxID=708192 RepID=A0AA37H114_9PEZI|nr:hypothetical protein ColLi_13183 [Colletotrichum liriopes]
MGPIVTIQIASELRIPILLTDATITRDHCPSRDQAWTDSPKSTWSTLADSLKPGVDAGILPRRTLEQHCARTHDRGPAIQLAHFATNKASALTTSSKLQARVAEKPTQRGSQQPPCNWILE